MRLRHLILPLFAAVAAGVLTSTPTSRGRHEAPRRILAGGTAERVPAAATAEPEAEDDFDAGRGPYPSDWFGAARAFPSPRIPQEKFRAAVAQSMVERAAARQRGAFGAFGTNGASLAWTEAGPFNIGGRVTALAAPAGGATVYLASANGGVFKSTNAGVNWTAVSPEIGVFSMGALALDPTNPDVVYLGTGEANASVDSYDGNGVYRSSDGGNVWVHIGLTGTARVARIAVDPSDPNRIFAATMGQQFSTGPERGLYRSEDGGASWEQVLFVSDSTGASDVVINPAHPETVYCATWERVRRPTYRRAYGPECGIWRSADHGGTWVRLQNGLPAPSDNVGRIGLAIAASRPSIVYAQIVSGAASGFVGLGLYRTEDSGESWVRRDASGFTSNFGGFAWYFGDVAVNPENPEEVWSLGVQLAHSTNGGTSFSYATGGAQHPDQHALWIDPQDPAHLYLGNDGGFFWSDDNAGAWGKSLDLPISQFYAGAIDPSNPSRLLGGTQDNANLATDGSPTGWSRFFVLADGFYCLVDHTTPNVWFTEYQYACGGVGPYRSINSGASFGAPSGVVTNDRFNWSTPFVMSPTDHNVMLLGSHRVYKSTNNGVSYTPVSGDLTTAPVAQLIYGTITTLDISAASPLVYYAGTDDGKVWRSRNAGASWEDISAGLPDRYVTRVSADPSDSNVVYVTHSGFGLDEPMPHVHRSPNMGDTWESIAGNLPDAPANDILVDPADPQTLYLATDVGVYATRNLGAGWFPLGSGMPLQTVFDLTLHAASRTLVAATHGRSQWRLDLGALPVTVGAPARPVRLALSSPRPNPTRGAAELSLEVSAATDIEIDVYDSMGRRVRSLGTHAFAPGRHKVLWDGREGSGRRSVPGVYFLRAAGGGEVMTRQVVRLE